METVIAECQDLISAERSVRWLETQGISIQNVSIVDEAKRIWRKSHPAWAQPSLAKDARRTFLLGAITGLLVSLLALAAYTLAGGQPLASTSSGLLVVGTSLVGGFVSALIGLKHRTGQAPDKARFSVILRSDAATLEVVGYFFPRVRMVEAAKVDGDGHGPQSR